MEMNVRQPSEISLAECISCISRMQKIFRCFIKDYDKEPWLCLVLVLVLVLSED